MKKYLSLLVIMLALVMQSFTILPGLTPVFFALKLDPCSEEIINQRNPIRIRNRLSVFI